MINMEHMQEANERLGEAVKAVQAEYPEVDISADFRECDQLKVKWIRSSSWITYDICDYYEDASVEDLVTLIDTCFCKVYPDLAKHDIPDTYGDQFGIVGVHRDTFLQRNGITPDDALTETAREYFRELGLPYADEVIVGTVEGRPMNSSAQFRTIVINRSDAIDLEEKCNAFACKMEELGLL